MKCVFPIVVCFSMLVFASASHAQDVTLSKKDAGDIATKEPLPSGLDAVRVGPLEITPGKANLIMIKEGDNTFLDTVVRFKVKNTSVGDVKILLFRRSILATDGDGDSLFDGPSIKSAGIVMSSKNPDDFNRAFQDEKGSFVVLSPKQVFELQLASDSKRRINDKNNEFIRTHRPKTATFSATLGLITVEEANELRAFSFSDVPLHIVTR